ncbi:BppU family phage baseplate upper protein [Bacillus thuringiensis]|uniref:BppU family phage baseplate upper protein n=1 Tax=Bacillus thuringiensis TaxID=1428 RepID=UPI000A36ACC5|nr:BppU family phage baseplate upper protein [Bacillus thuringiensis]MED2125443.1 BppU family phage baseplate upper protein [Bacillus thuringiensis]MED2146795.1 BppU family phage baseplate upper protein [Bacillus thuringiensis]MED2171496.1 BppU family phage baseplate upper protein [Bacillus thuringiensis]MED2476187.1 BppU family phage baseplate upper protein [Bacillus thuringiensis]MED2650741.1 BppU family phage baseplate upper protein [Bacillus thuringiensis]
MRNEVIVIDLADPVCTKTIRSRQNDKNGLKLTVHVKEKGKIVDVTGYVVKYEATNQRGQFIRDDAKIVDASKGIFEYILSSEAVSTPAEWLAYFVIEKSNTERTSTPDIRIVLRRDVKEGNIHIENYISEFDQALEMVKGYRKEIDEVNKRINELTAAVTGQKYQLWKVTEDDGTSIDLAADTDLNTVVKSGDYVGSKFKHAPNHSIYTWFISVESATSTALVQKATLLGNLNETYIRVNNSGKWSDWSRLGLSSEIVPKTGGTFTGEVIFSGGLKVTTDTEWTNLTITGAESVPDRPLRYKRSGKLVSVIGSVRNVKNVVNFATLPNGFRPVQNIAFSALAYGNLPSVCEVTIDSGGNLFVNGVQNGQTVHIVANFLV